MRGKPALVEVPHGTAVGSSSFLSRWRFKGSDMSQGFPWLARVLIVVACSWACLGSTGALGQLQFSGTLGVAFSSQLRFTDKNNPDPATNACPLPMTVTLDSPPPAAPGIALSSTGVLSGTP